SRLLRHWPLWNRPDRLAGHSIEDVQVAGLAGHGHDVDDATVFPDRRQLRRGIVVEIPDVVMDGLKMPQALPCSGIERDEAIAEQVRAFPVAAVEIELGAS